MANGLQQWLNRANLAWREQFQSGLASVMHGLGRDRFHASDFVTFTEQIPVRGLDPAFDGYRIVQISDIHMGHWISPERLYGIVELVNAEQPDLVTITGDFVSYVLDPLAADMTTALGQLQAPDGVVAVMGNHDHWLDVSAVRQILQASGVVELDNRVYPIERGAARIYAAGVDDIIAGQPDLGRVLDQLPDDGPAFLLAHEPDYADVSAATKRFFLQMSGHSHGGQIVLPRVGPPVRGELFAKYPVGRYQVGEMVQYTNRGVGTHVFRMRVNCPPEITLFTLETHSTG